MAPTINTCAGCKKSIKMKELLKCGICTRKYDLECANVTAEKFNLMDPTLKNTWKCPECRCKQPKTDNTNTPIRPALNPGGSSIDNCNVTLRVKPSYTTPESADIEGDYITENKLRSILKQEITMIMKSTVENVMSEHLRDINEKILDFQKTMSFFNHSYEDLKSKLEEKSTAVIELQKENAALKSSVRDLSDRLCSVEQNMRESNVEIVGVPEFKNENLTNTVVQLAKTVDSPINDEDILHVTRVAKISKQSDKPRSIVVKLRSPRKRDVLLAAVSNFNRKNAKEKLSSQHLGLGGPKVPVFVAEHLTPANKSLHAATRKKTKEQGYKFVWVRNGRIFVRKDEVSQAILIRSINSLNLII